MLFLLQVAANGYFWHGVPHGGWKQSKPGVCTVPYTLHRACATVYLSGYVGPTELALLEKKDTMLLRFRFWCLLF